MTKSVLKNFAKFTRKHLCGSLFINKVAQIFSCEFCKIFKNTYFEEHLSTTVDFWLSSKYASIISGNLLPDWLYLSSNNEPSACTCNSVFDILHLVTERRSHRTWSIMFIKILQISQDNTCVEVSTYQFSMYRFTKHGSTKCFLVNLAKFLRIPF